ncbi:UNC-like C-terminal-domain-containing protein [Russula emetica]|nr:UNC-like C-terminal-domain-containing protein [Russula emetica]
MSFSGTPLGQGRRLDHQTFLNKHHPSALQHTQFATRSSTATSTSDRSVPTSYAYGAPTLGTRSPPKPLSTTAPSRDSFNKAEHSSHHPAEGIQQDDIGLSHVSRLKQRDQTSTTIPTTNLANVNSRTATARNPDPTKWAVKGTSVQAANAIHQAAMALNPKDSWASSSRTVVPRSTSVEYEKETQSTSTRRLNAPPSRNGPPASRSTGAASRLAKQSSVRYVPDSEGEDTGAASQGRQERARTPLDSVIDIAKRTAFYLRQRSTEPDISPSEQGQNGHHAGNNEESYDYAGEEREFQALGASAKARNASAHKRGRISADNKAYRPTQSDLEQSDEEISDGGKRRRRKSKKNTGGPLTTLPVIDQERKRRRRSRTKVDGVEEGEDEEGGEGEEDEEEDSGSERGVSPQRSIHSSQRHSQPRELQLPPSRASIPRDPFITSPTSVENVADVSLDSHERGLDSIAEHNESPKVPSEPPWPQRSRRAFSIGGFLGRLVNLVLRLFVDLFIYVLRVLSAITNIVGQALGGAFDALFKKPVQWIGGSGLAFCLKWLIIGAVLYTVFLGLKRTNLSGYIPSLPSQTIRYQAPEVPAANIAELSERLQALENAHAGLSLDTEQSRARIDSQIRSHSDVFGRLGALESRLQKEGIRAAEDRNVDRVASSQGLQAVRHEIDALRGAVSAVQQAERVVSAGPTNDEEARAKLSALEDRVGTFEGNLREALEVSKSSVKTAGAVTSAAWWHKITSSGKKALSIKASDGQDVTELIGHLVDTAMERHARDTIAKADFALHSGGAVVIPSLTSDTHEVKPHGVRQQVISYLTGHGYAIGRPPITALHHETHVGHCWPFEGAQGQLGVTLSRIVQIEEITIDHVARDIAWDMSSAPRKMEVWGLVEGSSNFEKVAALDAARTEAGQEIPMQPRSLPHSVRYVRIAQFEYDIDAPNAVQTFPVDEDVRASGMDFGIIVLRVLSNWGQQFTCLYRFRAHGQMIEELDHPPAGEPTPAPGGVEQAA